MPQLDQRVCCIDKTGWKTKLACVVVALACHLFIGSLFNYPQDDFNQRFHYPNLGSSLFVLSVALYCIARSLHPKSLCIHSGILQTIYKVLMVIIISNVLLVAIWQPLVSLTIEFILILHDMLNFCNLPCGILVERTGCYLSHLIGFLMLVWVLTNMRCLLMCKPKDPSKEQKTPDSDSDAATAVSIFSNYSDDTDSYFIHTPDSDF
ncbi:hypothetical protein WDU94_005030 [Cyamophila willieti]